MYFEICILAAILLDQLFGDPRWLPHPVRLIGNLCTFQESVSRQIIGNQRLAGILTVIIVVGTTALMTFLLVKISLFFSKGLGYIAAILILYTTIAAKDLIKHSKNVYTCLHPKTDLEAARKAVGMIVGRDTGNLDGEGVSRACVETVAENMVDGVTAPLFYGILGGFLASDPTMALCFAAVGGMSYKAVNTMDSMFGYKNEKYIQFGWAAAKLDDLVNFLPARISGCCIIPGAAFLKMDWRKSAKMFSRDRLVHASPNAAHSEAAVAGALGVQLGGDSSYFGKIVQKPTIGDRDRDIKPEDILAANSLILVSSFLFVASMLLFGMIL